MSDPAEPETFNKLRRSVDVKRFGHVRTLG